VNRGLSDEGLSSLTCLANTDNAVLSLMMSIISDLTSKGSRAFYERDLHCCWFYRMVEVEDFVTTRSYNVYYWV
jgi:hypothetical protein